MTTRGNPDTDVTFATLADEARAKVNLTLRVLGRRIDGYHDLASLVVFADCADRLTLEPGVELSLAISGPGDGDCGAASDNLVLKAARLLAERVPDLRVGAFALDKQLPVAAGIGGGSADAAAALRLLARLNGLSLDDPRITEAARLTGADVPVCVASQSSVMTGIGEQLSLVRVPKMPCVMVNPRVAVATAEVFTALGLRKGEILTDVTDVVRSRKWPTEESSVEEWLKALGHAANDLEAPAIKIQPIIGEVLSTLRAASGVRLARMSGSGATCFGLFDSHAEARAVGQALQASHSQWWVHAGVLG
ncbi:MAG: 4-(cytidine 5'-diphospho)-2-C-methyl-D-erythritol kinase [Rhizobiales bacterium]|nr:4-(cytidine 5'-diphospho)-2-C-methyl-D-erythritol kinase [Hyphomicrobiales bacterium]